MTMKYLRDPSGAVHGFDTSDEAQVALMNDIADGWQDITGAWPPAPSLEQMWSQHQAAAQQALDASDMVSLRCFKAGVAFPPAWQSYVNELRSIVRASTGDPSQSLPTRPSYPSGT